MTTPSVSLTYVGRLARGFVTLPGRTVKFTAGVPVDFTEAEAAVLDRNEWTSPGTVPDAPASSPTEDAFEARRLAAGTVAAAREAVSARPEMAAAVLFAEQLGRNRPSLVAFLEELLADEQSATDLDHPTDISTTDPEES